MKSSQTGNGCLKSYKFTFSLCQGQKKVYAANALLYTGPCQLAFKRQIQQLNKILIRLPSCFFVL